MPDAFIRVVGWTLLHSAWQGALVVLLSASVLALLPRATAGTRYAILCGAMVMNLAAPIVTAVVLGSRMSHAPTPSGQLQPPIEGSTEDAPATGVFGTTARQTSSGGAPRLVSGPAAGRATIAESLERILPFVVVAWLLGVLSLGARYLGGWLTLRRLVARATPAPAIVVERTRALVARLGIRRPVRLLASAEIDGPFTSGWMRPVIVMPLAMTAGLDPAYIESILAHELAHVRRWDYVVGLLQSVALTLLFHHPATWWLDRRLRVEREYCCDDVAAAMSRDKVRYARALAELESLRIGLPGLAMAATGGSLRDRIERLLVARNAPRPSGWIPALALATVLLVASTVDASTTAGAPSPAPTARSPLAGAVTPRSLTSASSEIATEAGTAAGQEVIRHPDPRARLDARWAWALGEARRRDDDGEVVIGWRVRSAINDGNEVVSSTDGSSMTGGRSAAARLGISPSDTNGVAILLDWSAGARGTLSAVRLRTLDARLSLDGHPFLWLGPARDVESLALLEQILATTPSGSLRSELGAALSLHDDRDRALAAAQRLIGRDDDPRVRAETYAWMGRTPDADVGSRRERRDRPGDSTALSLLLRGVQDPSAQVRNEAVTAIDGLGPRSRTLLLELLRTSTHSDVRQEAAQRLSGGDDGTIAVLLRAAFDDESGPVRAEAVDAIKETGGRAARSALREIAASHPARRLRAEARDALAEGENR